MKSARATLLAVLLAIGTISAQGQQLSVAAASDLQAALPELAAKFTAETRRQVRLTFGSSGNFFAQIQNGAPFDVFLSADIEYPKRLEAAGLTEPGTLRRYATGRLVLWTRNDSSIDLSSGLKVLSTSGIGKIAIANPEHAPYGRAAVEVLRREGLYEKVRERLVMGENISQAAQFVQSGNADVGIIALSVALAPALRATGRHVQIASSMHPPIEQGAVVLKSAKDKANARTFLTFLGRSDTVRYLRASGFEAP